MATSSLNSFSALGFPDDEAVVDALRADLADILRGYIERSRMTQTNLSRQLGIPQSTLSAIKNDRIDHLSIEYFVRVLTRAGVPWTAKCWNAPDDAAWVAGGVSQLLANAKTDFRQVSPTEFWNNLAIQGPWAAYRISGQQAPVSPVSLKTRTEAPHDG